MYDKNEFKDFENVLNVFIFLYSKNLINDYLICF